MKPIFPFARPAADVIADLITTGNPDFNLTSSEVTFGTPVAGSGNAVSLTVQSTESGITGDVTVEYNRESLTDYFVNATPELDASSGHDDVTLAAYLLNKYQIYVVPDPSSAADQQSQVDAVLSSNAGVYTWTLTANNNNLVWTGSVGFTLTGYTEQLSDLLPNATLPALFSTPSFSPGQQHAEARYGILYDPNASSDGASALTTSSVFPVNESAWAIGVTAATEEGDAWVSSATAQAFNIAGATVLYNGPATGDWALGGQFASVPDINVLVIELGPLCTNLVGQLIIAYSATAPSPN